MNQTIYAYRAWLVTYPKGGVKQMSIKLDKPLTSGLVREIFKIPIEAKLTPVLDNRMKNGGKAIA